jgi:S1-C subfamily serine protease
MPDYTGCTGLTYCDGGKNEGVAPFDPAPRDSRGGRGSRALIPVCVVLFGVVLGVGGAALLRPFAASMSHQTTGGEQTPVSRVSPHAMEHLSDKSVYARIAPSVVDVTATLQYDDETASGTGFVIDAARGLILTNNHVIRDSTVVRVTLPATGHSYPAQIIGTDVPDDIAVLRLIGGPRLPAVAVGDSAALTAGTPVFAIGNQAGIGGSPSFARGVVSATGRTILADDGSTGFTETLHGMVQVTARIQPGDSGGPLADITGQVIGVDTAAGTGTAAAGYAIPIDVALRVAHMITAGRPGQGITLGVGGFLGVVVPSTATASPRAQAREEHNLGTDAAGPGPAPSCLDTEASAGVPVAIAPAPAGALVDGVLCGTAAAAAGIAPGDVITAAGGRPVTSPDSLTALVGAARPGTVMSVTWIAVAGTIRSALVRLDAAPAA